MKAFHSSHDTGGRSFLPPQENFLAAPTPAPYTISMNTPLYYVGLDVGGTSMKAGVVDDVGRPLSYVSLPTEAHRGQELGLERMCETIRQPFAPPRLAWTASPPLASPRLA